MLEYLAAVLSRALLEAGSAAEAESHRLECMKMPAPKGHPFSLLKASMRGVYSRIHAKASASRPSFARTLTCGSMASKPTAVPTRIQNHAA